ncbi:MAG: N-6 DNA methylase [Verrucomicrobia bacterium]|nr:N-6 DNA methylase [Verrucomicrobiota bacterium]MCH8511656.1 BREX-1 system adenine-specific DNA-methyltransferase PglX [Kiritimatiellia bacterium]
MPSLPKPLRNQLERTIVEAREVAEAAARAALQALAVDQPKAFEHMKKDEVSIDLRVRLRERGRAAGDVRGADKRQSIDHLTQLVAYEHWHRMLFARFLAENSLLLEPQYHVALSLNDVRELAREEKKDVWDLAGTYAQRMLPGVFRNDDAALEVTLAREDRHKLESLLAYLDAAVFTADDSLGWTYQFWQTRRKKEVNESGVKIGADEISPVTQLFTEDYMVEFLIHNTLGAWWAGRQAARGQSSEVGAQDEDAARRQLSLPPKNGLPGIDWTYLRFVQDDFRTSEDTQVPLSEARKTTDSALRTPHSALEWLPAAGTFENWPEHVHDITVMDPCMGSGHFLVFLLPVLARLRMEEEDLSAADAVTVVLRDNLHGLEIDERCCQIGAFNLALAAWKLGGYQQLPPLHIACSGLALNASKEEWKQLGIEKHNLALALDWLHDSFSKAPELGSLINPKRGDVGKLVTGGELMRALDQALARETDEALHESAVVAQGLAKATALLGGLYQWVITNVPYLVSNNQGPVLKRFCEEHYDAAKKDLATVFLDRCLELCRNGGSTSVVLPQNWLFLTTYQKFREKLLKKETWHLIARLGPGAFDTISGEVVKAILISLSRGKSPGAREELFAEMGCENLIRGLDVSEPRSVVEKARLLVTEEVKSVIQAQQLENPDATVILESRSILSRLRECSDGLAGILNGDSPKFQRQFWEFEVMQNEYVYQQGTVKSCAHFGGMDKVIEYDEINGHMRLPADFRRERLHDSDQRGNSAWGKWGVAISQMNILPGTLYVGNKFDSNIAVIVPHDVKNLSSIWCYCSSPEYNEAVRRIDQKLNVTNATLVKVPFDLDHWQKVAEEKYPHGLPEPYSDDPTQWIFHGHPFGSVVWDEAAKWTAHGPPRADATVLQVAVARLLGYRWPAELDPDMELAAEQREWVKRCEALLPCADQNGIVCLTPLRTEGKAAERLRKLLDAAGTTWNERDLIAATGSNKRNLEDWLRDEFFEQHCRLFHNRPFVWHIWDGRPDGFHALVNYHKLAAPDGAGAKLLETLTFAYLGDWIRRQKDDAQNEVPGARDRLIAAEALHTELQRIQAGKPPYDLFIRWKPLHQQPIGWNPDINDGVRLNIRPFLNARDVNKKGAGILRAKPNIKWTKDRGNEPHRDKTDFPWFWGWDENTTDFQGGPHFDGNRWNDLHYSNAVKEAARKR